MDIEHSVPLAEFLVIENPVLRQVTLMKTLRERGIPVVGTICIERCESGSLTIEFDELFQVIWYRWLP